MNSATHSAVLRDTPNTSLHSDLPCVTAQWQRAVGISYPAFMDHLLAFNSIGISDLREAPARAFEQAGDGAVVVLNHNRTAGYIVSPSLMARIMDQLADRVVSEKARSRLATLGKSRKVTLDEL